MITAISLENFLFMPDARLNFSNGVNVITGETGAGKSVLLEAVKLLLGKKARSGVVFPGKSSARVQAEFDISRLPELQSTLEESGFCNEDEPGLLTITRTFKEEGSGRVLVNGLLTTSAFLKKIGPFLMEIHGQNEHQTLLLPEVQRSLLDRTGSKEHKEKLLKLSEIFRERQKIQEKVEEWQSRSQNSEARIEELESIISDLKSLDSRNKNEEEELKDDLKRLSHSEQIIANLQNAAEAFSGNEEINGAVSQIYRATESLRKVAQYDQSIDDLFQRTNGIYYELQAIQTDVENRALEYDMDPEKLNQIQTRLSEISRLCRKYATDFSGLFELQKEAVQELDDLSAPDNTFEKLSKQLKEIDEQFKSLVQTVSNSRKKLAADLETKVSEEMSRLGFNAARFIIDLKTIQPGLHGGENIDFHVSLNPGAPGGSLRKIASGGELSRVALAIKKTLARCDDLPTLVFDEIDAGIGGKTAESVAESLRSLGKEKQVLLVTHLHQIAKEGKSHFTVNKNVKNGRTIVKIEPVEGKDRIEEIARMLGQTDSAGIDFARGLLEKGNAEAI